jgi:hypothetical protein
MRTLIALAWLSVQSCPSSCTPPTSNPDPDGDTDEPAHVAEEREQNLDSEAGDFAEDFLRDDDYPSLHVEIDHVAGKAPSQAALDRLEQALLDWLDKPDGVEIVVDDAIPATGAPTWTYDAAEELEIEWRDHYRDPATGEAVIYFLYLDGDSEFDDENGRVLGYAYHGSSLVMFKDTIDDVGGLPLLTVPVEPTVITHELGHVLGLVNNGIPMQSPHQDASHGAHDSNEDCLMYWAVHTDQIVDVLLNGEPTLDAACEADLAAVRDAP